MVRTMIHALKTPLCLTAVALIVALAVPASAATGDWAEGQKTRIRLVASGANADGTIDGAIEIALPAGWKTYWRNPGTAGIAPEFDFSASHNLDTPAVSFPVPEVVDDGYSVTNVYVGGVVLPFRAAVSDPKMPVELALTVRLGVCDDVCVPDEVTAHLVVPPGENDPATEAVLATARARLPGPPQPGVFTVDSVARQGGTDMRPVFRLTTTVPAGTEPKLLVEGPVDWAPYAPAFAGRDGDHVLFDLKFSRLGANTPIAGAKIRVTMEVAGRAVEQTVPLD
jgi:DsbC/DsbD-like thiol-disulfide interchange protein